MSQIFTHNTGSGTGNGSAIQITLGYTAKSVKVINATTLTTYYWNDSLGSDVFVTSSAGNLSIDATGMIALSSTSGNIQNAITILATAVGNLEDYTYEVNR